MNKKKLLEILNPFIVSKNALSENGEIENIKTNLQGSKAEDLVFYKINANDPRAIEQFNKRKKMSQASLLVMNHGAEFCKDDNVLFVDESNFLRAQKAVLDLLFPNKNKLKLVGVTGTNGKTTTVNLAMQIATAAGHRSFSVGTIGLQDSDGIIASDLESTTPSYVDLRKIIHRFQDHYEACFMEVSSHALVQNRLFDLRLDAAAWTSFSQDHLDYHQNMEEYFKAKLLIEKIFVKPEVALLIPFAEKNLYQLILQKAPETKIKIAPTLDDRKITNRPLFYRSPYNQSNVEIALELNAQLFGPKSLEGVDLAKIKTPLGRFSLIELGNNNFAIVDYAHTPDALINIGQAIKLAFPDHSITVVFGCGGNRDKTKRPLMGKAVSTFAQKIIVTSDNPRDEAPEDIIVDVLAGIEVGYEAMVDRQRAILSALEEIGKNEIVLIAGKGHEEYQEIKGEKFPFSDFNIVKNFKPRT